MAEGGSTHIVFGSERIDLALRVLTVGEELGLVAEVLVFSAGLDSKSAGAASFLAIKLLRISAVTLPDTHVTPIFSRMVMLSRSIAFALSFAELVLALRYITKCI